MNGGGAPLSAWPSMSTFTGALLREFACLSDLSSSSMRSFTRRASASLASRATRCSEVSFAGGSSALDSGSVESSERIRLSIERNQKCGAVASEHRMDRMVGRKGFGWTGD